MGHQVIMRWKNGASYVEADETFVKNTQQYCAPTVKLRGGKKNKRVEFIWAPTIKSESNNPTLIELIKKNDVPGMMELRGTIDEQPKEQKPVKPEPKPEKTIKTVEVDSVDYVNDIFIKEVSGCYVATHFYQEIISASTLDEVVDLVIDWMENEEIQPKIWLDQGTKFLAIGE